jgi:hypothetical protein
LKSLFLFLSLLTAGIVSAQVPVINSVRPSSATVGSPQVTVDILGQHLTGSTAYWNGAGLTTTVVSDAEVTAVVPATLLGNIGTGVITVATSGMSSGFLFQVRPLLAQVRDWSPKIFTTGHSTTLTVYGQNFAAGSVIYFDWQPISTTFVSSNQLNGTVGSGLVTSGRHTIQVLGGTPTAATKLLALSTLNLSLGSTIVGTTTSAGTITLTNIGPATVTFAGFSLGGVNPLEFAISANTCGATLASAGTCIVSITATPAGLGSRIALFSTASDAAGSPLSANLAVTGTPTATISVSVAPATLDFGSVPQSSASAPLTVTLTNTGTGNYAISALSTTGANSGDFARTGACSISSVLTPGGSCTITETFTPATTAAESASVSVTDNAPGSPRTIPLAGVGITAGTHYAALSWSASPSTSVTGYNVYRATVTGGPYTLLTTGSPVSGLTYTDLAVSSGNTYYYVVTAAGTNPPYSPTDSVNSTEVSATIP